MSEDVIFDPNKKKTISFYITLGNLDRLDRLNEHRNRSDAINKIFNYILSQSDDWVKELIKPDPENVPNSSDNIV